MITLEHVTKRFGKTVAVDDVSLEVKQGELAILLGPSGCGKTTTLRSINRMHGIDSGRILVDGVDIYTEPAEELRRRIGYVIQSVGLFPHMSVARNVGAVPRLLGWDRARIDRRVDEMLELVGLDPAVHGSKKPSQLSGGQQQRVGVARALAADPPVLLMDEPFGALDPISRQRLQSEFARLQREVGKTVVFVTHDVEEAVALGDRIALMETGQIVQFDTPEALLRRPASPLVTEFFGRELALKVLSRHTLADVIFARAESETLREQSVSRAGDSFSGRGDVPRLTPADTLREALASMVSSGSDRVVVPASNDGSENTLTFTEIVAAMKEGAS